jgi:hypothetical protein
MLAMRGIPMDKRLESLKKGYKTLDDRERAYILGMSRALAFALREAGTASARDGKKGRAGRTERAAAPASR